MSPIPYRRGACVWALILIAIGVIFLLQNFNPAVHPWKIVARYWPVLIIVWGISKLIDYVQARAHPESAAPPMFSGADVILLVLILIFGTLVSRLVLAPWGQWRSEWGIHWGDNGWRNPFLNSYTYTESLTQAAPENSHLIVVDRRGGVGVGGSASPRISVVVKETIRAAHQQDANKLNSQLALQIVKQGGSDVFDPNLGALPNGGGNVRLDLTIRVPKRTSTDITTRHGDAMLDGLQGRQAVTSSDGDVQMAGIQGAVEVEKSGGAIDLRNVKGPVQVSGRGSDVGIADVSGLVTVNGEFIGLVRFERLAQGVQFTSSRTHLTARKVSGKLEMQRGALEAADIDGALDISTQHKDIHVAQFRDALTITDSGGNIILQAAAPLRGPIVVNSKNGDIELGLPAASSFVIDAASRNGQVDSDFSSSSLVIQSQGNRPSIKGTYGRGGPTIHLYTTYGTIHVMRESDMPSHPAATGGIETKLRRFPASSYATPGSESL